MEMGKVWLVKSLMPEKVLKNNKRKKSHNFRLSLVLGYPLEEVGYKMSK
jgi:hypothetical protein